MTLPLVLLPGMMCDARLFAPQIAAFDAARAVIVPALTADSIAGMAEEVLAAAPERFALAGLSLGGIVAMEIVARAPGRVARVAFLDTSPRAETATQAARRLPQIAAARAGGLAEVMREAHMPWYLAPGSQDPAILDLCLEMALGLGAEIFARQSHALMTRPDQCAALARVRLPTLVLCGRDDALCPLHRHELIARLVPGARLCIVEGAGHLPTLERPGATTAALARWLGTG